MNTVRLEASLYTLTGDSARDMFEVEVWVDAVTVKTYSKVYKIESLRSGVTVLRMYDNTIFIPPTYIVHVREIV